MPLVLVGTLALLRARTRRFDAVFVLGLVRLRVVTTDRLRRNRRVAFVLLLIFAALLPTVDPVSLILEIVPLLLLLEASIWASVFLERRWHGAPALR